MSLVRFALVSLVFAAAVRPAPAQLPRGIVAGQVVDSGGKGVSGAQVTLDRGRRLTTNRDGGFRFESVRTGTHRLVVRSTGFLTNEVRVEVTKTSNARVTVRLVVQPTARARPDIPAL